MGWPWSGMIKKLEEIITQKSYSRTPKPEPKPEPIDAEDLKWLETFNKFMQSLSKTYTCMQNANYTGRQFDETREALSDLNGMNSLKYVYLSDEDTSKIKAAVDAAKAVGEDYGVVHSDHEFKRIVSKYPDNEHMQTLESWYDEYNIKNTLSPVYLKQLNNPSKEHIKGFNEFAGYLNNLITPKYMRAKGSGPSSCIAQFIAIIMAIMIVLIIIVMILVMVDSNHKKQGRCHHG